MMLPPEKVFPQRKAAEFDEAGRPHHFLFYAGRPHFFQLLYDSVEQLKALDKFEDSQIKQQKKPDPEQRIETSGSEWISQEQLELKLVETIREVEYRYFQAIMERIIQHPYAFRAKEFLDQYRRTLLNQKITLEIPKPEIGEDGRSFITVYGEKFLPLHRKENLIFNFQNACGKGHLEMSQLGVQAMDKF